MAEPDTRTGDPSDGAETFTIDEDTLRDNGQRQPQVIDGIAAQLIQRLQARILNLEMECAGLQMELHNGN